MKRTMRFIWAAFVMMATVGFVACTEEEKPEPPTPEPNQYTESSTVGLEYKNNAVAAGDTLIYNYTSGVAMVDFYLVNKTQEPIDAYVKVEKLEGPEAMGYMGFCTDVCANFTCPFVAPKPTRPFTIQAGAKGYFDLQFYNIEPGVRALYKLTAGSGQELQDPQIIFLRVSM